MTSIILKKVTFSPKMVDFTDDLNGHMRYEEIPESDIISTIYYVNDKAGCDNDEYEHCLQVLFKRKNHDAF